MTIRLIQAEPGHRGVIVIHHPVTSLAQADLIGQALVQNGLNIVDLLDSNGLIIKAYRPWGIE